MTVLLCTESTVNLKHAGAGKMAHAMAPVTLRWLVNELSGRKKATAECNMMFNDFVGDVRISKVHNH